MIQHAPTGTDTPIQVTFEVPDRESLVSVLELLSDASVSVQTETITEVRFDDDLSVQIDLGRLTEKQHEALRLALEEGYYERPRTADLAALAERLGISKSAVSQRLRTAEIKLVESALGRHRSQDDSD